MERRLTAILAADVVGFGRLMGLDEAGTLTALKNRRTEFIDRKVSEHQRRIFKLTGDGMLVMPECGACSRLRGGFALVRCWSRN